ncbi:hypothetical protein ACPV5U_05950 [Vibrio mediterranei]
MKLSTVAIMSIMLLASSVSMGYGPQEEYKKETHSTTMKFELVNNTIILNSRIGNEQYRFVLDTGAPTLVSQYLVEANNLKRTGSMLNFTDTNGDKGQLDDYYLPSIIFGDIFFKNHVVSLWPMLGKKPLSCYSLSGILGFSMLKNSVLSLDFINNRMTISDSTPVDLKRNGYSPVGFYFNGSNAPIISLSQKFGNIDVFLDTGYNGGIALYHPELHTAMNDIGLNGVEINGGITYFSAKGGNKNTDQKIYNLNNFDMGLLHIEKYPVIIGSSGADSIVGVKFLKQFDIVIDFKSAVAWFRPNGLDSSSEVIPKLGVYMVPKGNGLIVDGVVDGSDADLSGISPGDVISEVDEKIMKGLTKDNYCKILTSDEDKRSSYKIINRNGKQIKLNREN